MPSAPHERLYAHAELYAVAFSWRDVPAQCAFIERVFARHAGRAPLSVLELASGPSEHALVFAAAGLEATALDLSEGMLKYAAAQAERLDVALRCVRAPMTDFTLPRRVDLALCMIDSLSYLLDHDALKSHLTAVAEAVEPGGLYLIELAHPAGSFGLRETTEQSWETRDEARGVSVEMTFGLDDDVFDAVHQVRQTTVLLRATYDDGSPAVELRERCALRLWLYPELLAAITAHQEWDLVDTFGAFDERVALTHAAPAWRMILALQRRPLTPHL